MQSGVTSLFPAQNLKRPHQEDTWHPLPTRVSFAARSSSLAARQSPEEYPESGSYSDGEPVRTSLGKRISQIWQDISKWLSVIILIFIDIQQNPTCHSLHWILNLLPLWWHLDLTYWWCSYKSIFETIKKIEQQQRSNSNSGTTM